ncbi:c-type cytochrome [Luteibacter aegosomaticola]|uniref:c-type cytochrome n=1 Tax=Luteibacter aegosomaticola TaxID=2911538 RepID=UPI001FFA8852|nr:c-type cytochrome [Luteibacter aegosomaticola]UPG92211.1 c-type cytochrome [Luteibacter aegosomaticola]
MKKLLLTLISVGIVVLAAALAFAYWPTHTRAIDAGPAADAALVEKGRYLAYAGDCTACHTKPGGAAFAGGLPIASPLGTIYSSNITPDAEHGIGHYTLDQFDRAVRHGIAANGSSLYPAMPFPSYARMTDDDVRALYAYFLHGDIKPSAEPNRATDIPWPLSMRWPLAIWRKLFAPVPDAVAFDDKRYTDPKIARGAYLVQGLGHCGSCHTPRGVALQEKALDEQAPGYLAGGQVIDGWFAVNLRGNTADGLGRWSEQDIVDTLKTARNAHSAIVGQPMADVAVHSTQHLSDDDLHAIAAYVKSLPATANDPSSYTADDHTAKALQAGINDSRGAEIYVDNCAACHRTDANGYTRVFPAIAGNPTVLADDPTTLVRLILGGSHLPSTQAAPSPLGMPAFGDRLSDDEVAKLATFVRGNFGNHAGAVDASAVSKVRATLPKE